MSLRAQAALVRTLVDELERASAADVAALYEQLLEEMTNLAFRRLELWGACAEVAH